jgi:hypothetical protein
MLGIPFILYRNQTIISTAFRLSLCCSEHNRMFPFYRVFKKRYALKLISERAVWLTRPPCTEHTAVTLYIVSFHVSTHVNNIPIALDPGNMTFERVYDMK